MKTIKRCEYRHCNLVVVGNKKRKFCCDNHRKMEFTYIKRELQGLKKKSKIYNDLIQEAESNKDSSMIELYKLIYK